MMSCGKVGAVMLSTVASIHHYSSFIISLLRFCASKPADRTNRLAARGAGAIMTRAAVGSNNRGEKPEKNSLVWPRDTFNLHLVQHFLLMPCLRVLGPSAR